MEFYGLKALLLSLFVALFLKLSPLLLLPMQLTTPLQLLLQDSAGTIVASLTPKVSAPAITNFVGAAPNVQAGSYGAMGLFAMAVAALL
ncbi:hypothetical protein DID88_006399 [Monilinia fructigena]|uniref:Uncharacterized protein n=1 Tax=Monilinia fructigena TaxID=38457 RepID=A0A395IG90_9HELO|nr:hypothetical protein DID88_006399 [Monilinia fructigena]